MNQSAMIEETGGRTPGIDFQRIHRAILVEPALLHPSLADLQESFEAGLAVAQTEEVDDGQVAIGYSRVIPLLSREQITALDLPVDFPDIYELGTVFVLPEYRGQRIAEGLQRQLIRRFKQQLDQNEILILGTTKTRKVLHQLDKLADEGVEFYHSRHTEFPHLAPVTCVCEPDFGSGFQFGTECPQRITETEMETIHQTLPRNGVILLRDVDKIPCTMFVSNRDLAARVDTTIAQAYGQDASAQEAFVNRLVELNYFL